MGGLFSSLPVMWSGLGKDPGLSLSCWACTAQDTWGPCLLWEGGGHGGAEAEARCPPPTGHHVEGELGWEIKGKE